MKWLEENTIIVLWLLTKWSRVGEVVLPGLKCGFHIWLLGGGSCCYHFLGGRKRQKEVEGKAVPSSDPIISTYISEPSPTVTPSCKGSCISKILSGKYILKCLSPLPQDWISVFKWLEYLVTEKQNKTNKQEYLVTDYLLWNEN